jgi:hypothetical protein
MPIAEYLRFWRVGGVLPTPIATVPAERPNNESKLGNSSELLPDGLIRRNTPAGRTRHELGGGGPATMN